MYYMPNIQSAKKKVRKDVKREATNLTYKKTIKKTLKKAGTIKTGKKGAVAVSEAYSIIDKAVKKKIVHKNKAARLKSRISRSLNAAK